MITRNTKKLNAQNVNLLLNIRRGINMELMSGILILPYIELILKICMYFSITLCSIKAVQALNIYINKNKKQ